VELVQLKTGEKFYLAQSLTDVKEYLGDIPEHDVIGVDTETTGLDHKKDHIVGFSIAISERSAVYIPVKHLIGTNVPLEPAVAELKSYIARHSVTPVFWNGKFDVSMFEVCAGWVPASYEDGIELVYLDNPDREEKGLKAVAKEDLGFEMTAFEDLFTAEEKKAKAFNIAVKAPKRCTEYACADANATLRLFIKYKQVREQFKFPYKVDTILMELIRKMELTGGMELNIDYIEECKSLLDARLTILEGMIWRAAGQEFAIGSPKQLGDILFEKLGLPSQGLTKNGQHATGAKELAKLAEQFPIAEWVVSYKKIQKAKGSYFKKLSHLHSMGIPPRFSFNQYAAPTFRLAAPGGDPDLDGKTGINIQAVSNGEARTWAGVSVNISDLGKSTNEYVKELDDDDVLFDTPSATPSSTKEISWEYLHSKPWVWSKESGDKVCILESCNRCDVGCQAAGLDVTRRPQDNVMVLPSVRQAFRAPKGYVMMACDYDRQELVIGANLSKEPKWISALLQDSDLHAITAKSAFKLSDSQWENLPPDERKRKRGIGKILNFATFYGATAHTLSRNTGLPLPVAEQIYDGFVKGHPQLFSWMAKMKIFARRHGYTSTYFGRRRWLKQFYDQGTKAMQAFADRSSVNTAVQGTGADVTRIAMVKSFNWLNNNTDWDEARLVMSIHDELVFLIKESILDAVGPRLVECMTFNVSGWDVQLSVEPKVGVVWGQSKKYKFKECS